MNIAVIGTGSMGGALSRHLAKGHSVILCNRTAKKAQDLAQEIGGSYSSNLIEAVKKADVIILAVKPKDFIEVSQEIAPSLTEKQLLISVLSGTSMEMLRKHLPKTSIVRIMPNMALTCGEGIIGLVEHPSVSSEIKKITSSLLKDVGLLYWLPEDKIEVLAALCASSPAFIYVMVEAMTQWGIRMGFPDKAAGDLVLKTFEGALAVLRESQKQPQELINQIASPGGTTRAGLKVMEEKNMGEGLQQALQATYQRSMQIVEESSKKKS